MAKQQQQQQQELCPVCGFPEFEHGNPEFDPADPAAYPCR
jgi:hypothetical protein